MKFVDQVRIMVKAGDGGNGCVAFRREKFVDKGGPSGGDGGNGGSIFFVGDSNLTTLLDFRYQQHHRAQAGQHGMGSDCNGKNGDDLVLKVPVGTLVKDEATGETLCDIAHAGQRFVGAKGGRGGLGNINFATSTRQTPRFAQDGTLGEEKTLVLELKLLADVGLLGFPNAGKSTFIAAISHARPKIADYPFTTLVPNLGVVDYKDRRSFVVADIPGLVEGASEGVGLGHRFLKHVERCRVLVHLIDLSAGAEGRDPVHDFDVLNHELERYSPELASKPQLVVANKLDLTHAREALPAFKEALHARGVAVLELSSATGEGKDAVLDACARVLFTADTAQAVEARTRDGLRLFTTAKEVLAHGKPKRAAKAAPKAVTASRKVKPAKATAPSRKAKAAVKAKAAPKKAKAPARPAAAPARKAKAKAARAARSPRGR